MMDIDPIHAFTAVVAQRNIRPFSKAILCCSKIGGSDLSISTTQDAISFSTLNQSQSSIATFRFSRQFFTKFWLDHPIKCKVNLRQMLLAFRSLTRTKEITFNLAEDGNVLVMENMTHSGIKIKYSFSFEDQDTILEADFSRQDLSCIACKAKIFQHRILDNFATGLNEISLVPVSNSITVKSYLDGEPKNKFLYTECRVDASEFNEFRINREVFSQDITFPLKEIKAMISFCKDLDLDLILHFDTPGKPLLMSNSKDTKEPLFAELVVSTLGVDEFSQSQYPEFEGDQLDQSSSSHHAQNVPPHRSSYEAKRDSNRRRSNDMFKQQQQQPQNSPDITPTQVSSWNNETKPSAAVQNLSNPSQNQSEVDSKFSFDLYPPEPQNRIDGKDDRTTTQKRRRIIDAAGGQNQRTAEERTGANDSDSEGSYVSGTPESD